MRVATLPRAEAAEAAAAGAAEAGGADFRPPTLQELQRRHELLAVFKCYGRFHLLRVVPQIAVLAICEVIVAELAGNRARARAVVLAWRWNLGRLDVIRAQRKELNDHRRLGDKEIRLLQVGGSARLSAYGRRVFQHGFHGAHADELAAVEEGTTVGGIAGARRATTAAPPTGVEGRLTGRTRLTVWLGAAVVRPDRIPEHHHRPASGGRPVHPLPELDGDAGPSSGPDGIRRVWGRPHRHHPPWP